MKKESDLDFLDGYILRLGKESTYTSELLKKEIITSEVVGVARTHSTDSDWLVLGDRSNVTHDEPITFDYVHDHRGTLIVGKITEVDGEDLTE